MSIITKIKEVFRRLFTRQNIQSKINTTIAVSDKMAAAIDLWTRCYKNHPPWRYDENGKEKVKTLNLPAIIASELSRLVTTELESSVENKTLDEAYQTVVRDLRHCCELGCAGGGLAFKPVPENGRISVDYVSAESFFPTDYDTNGDITGAIFVDKLTKGDTVYTKLEQHRLEGKQYTIRNYAFKNETQDPDVTIDLGRPIPLTDVPEWAAVEEEKVIAPVLAPLFAYFKMPGTNPIDKTSPLGVSCFAKALEQIEQADRQYDRLLWEYEGSELALDLPADWFAFDEVKQKWRLPEGKERLFRVHDMDDDQNSRYNIFSPAIRDASLFNGLDNLLKRIEFNCGLSYGTISDPQNVDKTATEIISSKQRLYSTVKDIQLALEDALQHMVYAMSVWMNLSGQTVPVGPEVTFNWDDSIVIDKQAELLAMQQDVASGILRPEIYLAKKYGVTEKEALKMMPDTEESIDTGLSVSDPNSGGNTDEIKHSDEVEAAEEIAGKPLNGAQTQSLLGIIGQYSKGELTLGQAINLISVAIGISKEEAKKIIEGSE